MDRFYLAFAVAVLSDILNIPEEIAIVFFGIGIPLSVAADLITAGVIIMLMPKKDPRIVAPAIMEAIPGIGLIPFWTLYVFLIRDKFKVDKPTILCCSKTPEI